MFRSAIFLKFYKFWSKGLSWKTVSLVCLLSYLSKIMPERKSNPKKQKSHHHWLILVWGQGKFKMNLGKLPEGKNTFED